MPRKFREIPTHISMFGLGYVGYSKNILRGNLLGDKVGVFELNNPISCIEVRNEKSIRELHNILK